MSQQLPMEEDVLAKVFIGVQRNGVMVFLGAAYYQSFLNGDQKLEATNAGFSVRAIRAF